MITAIRSIKNALPRNLLWLPLFVFGCCSPPGFVDNERKEDNGSREVINSPKRITPVQFNVRYFWKVGTSLDVPRCGEIDLMQIGKGGIRLRRDMEGSIPAVPARISVGNNVIMIIKEIDKTNKWLRVEFVERRPYVM